MAHIFHDHAAFSLHNQQMGKLSETQPLEKEKEYSQVLKMMWYVVLSGGFSHYPLCQCHFLWLIWLCVTCDTEMESLIRA